MIQSGKTLINYIFRIVGRLRITESVVKKNHIKSQNSLWGTENFLSDNKKD